jgi:hypothetical protein
MNLALFLKSMIDLKILLKSQKASNIDFMKEINKSEHDLIYIDEESEIEAFKRLGAKKQD